MLITYKVKIYELTCVLFNYHVGIHSSIFLWFSLGGHQFMGEQLINVLVQAIEQDIRVEEMLKKMFLKITQI